MAYIKWFRGILPYRLKKGTWKLEFPNQIGVPVQYNFRSLPPHHAFCTFDENVNRKYVHNIIRLNVPTLSNVTKKDVKFIQ
jgi:hypothetical protein